ncbi:PTS sugar transporter subunit IIA [Planctomicrobium sp. SH668]|uniref:PTS sugar transporter subunit IIA n=1 Tax=Planctomicrobium sp. SH668 TaxID=3448126 RepID=UPI003F5BA65B
MAHEWYSVDELARQLGRDRREIERLASRGRIPAHKRGNEWQFHAAEVTHWLEQEMRDYSDSQLAFIENAQASSTVKKEIPVSSLLKPELIQVPMDARTKRSALETLVEIAGRTWQIWEPAAVLKAVQDRESLQSTAFDNGVALPHPRNPLTDAIGDSLIAFGRTLSGIPFGASNNAPTDCFFLILCKDAHTHLQVLARLSRMIQLPDFLSTLRNADSAESTYEVILSAERQFK